jgi:hypothetical protein
MGRAAKLRAVKKANPLIKLDLGSGPNPKEGFLGVDIRHFGDAKDSKVGLVHDLRTPWPWTDGQVEEAHCSHFLEHLTGLERVHFVNELYRVLIPGGKCLLVTPHWASTRAYGDYTHQWPPVSEFWFYYLNAEWRTANAPHNDLYACDFEATWGYSLHPQIASRNQEYQQHALTFWREAAQDMVCTLVKRAAKPV